MEKFQNKYRIPSARASWWDYANAGAYFITICTANREYLFGEIKGGVMHLSSFGTIVQEEWEKSFGMRAELHCDVWVVMPNHIHAIVRIEAHETNVPDGTDAQPYGCTGVAYRSPKSVSSFVAGFKSVVTKRVNELRKTPAVPVWQTRFHDHIIRNEMEYQRIYNYIVSNVEQWEKDKFFQIA